MAEGSQRGLLALIGPGQSHKVTPRVGRIAKRLRRHLRESFPPRMGRRRRPPYDMPHRRRAFQNYIQYLNCAKLLTGNNNTGPVDTESCSSDCTNCSSPGTCPPYEG